MHLRQRKKATLVPLFHFLKGWKTLQYGVVPEFLMNIQEFKQNTYILFPKYHYDYLWTLFIDYVTGKIMEEKWSFVATLFIIIQE